MATAAQVHLNIKKGDRVTFHCNLLLFVAAPAGRSFFTAPMVAGNTVLFQIKLVFAVMKKNRPEVSFKRNDLRAWFYFSGSGEEAAAEKQAYSKHTGQQLCNHRTLGPVQHFRGSLIIALGHLRRRAELRLFIKIDGVFFFQIETAQSLCP